MRKSFLLYLGILGIGVLVSSHAQLNSEIISSKKSEGFLGDKDVEVVRIHEPWFFRRVIQ